jgi:large subunit ribosomal protein L22
MITRAIGRYLRITPRKFRQIIPLVKGKNPEDAIAILMNVNKKASVYAIELLKSAVANAKRMDGVDVSSLYISRMFADCGPQLKRYRAASMGRASQIRKRTSHITIELDALKAAQAPAAASEKEQGVKAQTKVKAKETKVKTETAHGAKKQPSRRRGPSKDRG